MDGVVRAGYLPNRDCFFGLVLRLVFADAACWAFVPIMGMRALTESPITIERPTDNDRADERPDKYSEPFGSIVSSVASSDAEEGTDCKRD